MAEREVIGVSLGDNTSGESVPPRTLPLKILRQEDQPTFVAAEFEPNIFIYDNYPGGIGLSPSLFELETTLLEHCLKTIEVCPCREGCPSCVGPTKESGEQAKQIAREILKALL